MRKKSEKQKGTLKEERRSLMMLCALLIFRRVNSTLLLLLTGSKFNLQKVYLLLQIQRLFETLKKKIK